MVKRKLKEEDSSPLLGGGVEGSDSPVVSSKGLKSKGVTKVAGGKKKEPVPKSAPGKEKVPVSSKAPKGKSSGVATAKQGKGTKEDDDDMSSDDLEVSSEDLSMEEVEVGDEESDDGSAEEGEEEEDEDEDDDDEEEVSSSDNDEENKEPVSDNEEGEEDDSDKSESEDDEGIEKDSPFEFAEMSSAVKEESIPHPHPSNGNVTDEDEYQNDSSDEEDIRNTIGNVPLNWYDEYPHTGYDLDGRRLIKPKKEDKLDEFLRRMEDPNFWRTVKDSQTGQNVVMSDKDVEFIKRLQSGKTPDSSFDNFTPWMDWFSSEVMETPLRNMPLSKASFLPSKIDKMKISKMVHAIKMGWMKPKPKPSTEPNFYMLWDSDDKAEEIRRIHDHIPAPKVRLPNNAESYNPPAEYLFDEKEMKDWESKDEEPWRRRHNFVPHKYKSLREVPAYDLYMKERFQRCLDLYLCPRAKKMRLTIKAEDLVPQLPNPKDLQPFPTVCSMIYKGHSHMVRSITLEPHGQFFASGSEDGTVKVWEIATGRCMKTFNFGCVVRWVEWCPNKSLSLLAVAADSDVMLINPGVGDKLIVEKTDLLLTESPDQGEYNPSEKLLGAVQWEPVDEEKWDKGIRILIRHFKNVNQVTWHAKGDYFSSVMHEGQNRSVVIHQLSSRRSQLPLNRSKGLIQCVLFHPIRPIFFIATQRHVRVYDLLKQEMIKKLMSGAKWISSMAIHPGGDNVIIGTYDKKVMWFDLDLSTKPYQTLRFHGNAIRSVAFHKRYPLFASGSDDLNIIISHGMVYNDLLQNPLIVPVKKLRGHNKFSDYGVLSVIFHNMQPWVFSSGADKTIRLYT